MPSGGFLCVMTIIFIVESIKWLKTENTALERVYLKRREDFKSEFRRSIMLNIQHYCVMISLPHSGKG